MKITKPGDEILNRVKRIHFVGIGGSGMCPLAEILHQKGYSLTGSDNNESDPLKRIRALNIPVFMGQRAENIAGAELVVYSAAISQDNPELVAARKQQIPTMERCDLLGILTRKFSQMIGVCGTHGKTTASSMITQVLYLNNMDPTAVIGGRLPLINANGRAGSSELMVCESCEFVDTFLHLSPDTAVLLNIDNDHLDYFKTIENLTLSFHKFLKMAGKVYFNGDDPLCHKAAEGISASATTFGLNPENTYHAANLQPGLHGMRFTVFQNKRELGCIELSIPGQHNVYNALATIAVCTELGLTLSEIKQPLESFTGAGRRFERYGNFGGITLVDDYAHHPTELQATLNAAKNLNHRHVIAVFQPFTFSRTALLKEEFIQALKLADAVILTPIMGSREVNTYGISSEDLAAGLPNCTVVQNFDEVVTAIETTAGPGDIVITMGGGDIYKAAQKFAERHRKEMA